jgi:hypothetical protein
MVYKLIAQMEFATVAARNAALGLISGAVSRTLHNRPGLSVERSDPGAIPIQSAYTTAVSAGDTNGALAGSHASWHACYHGELAQLCALSGSKAW